VDLPIKNGVFSISILIHWRVPTMITVCLFRAMVFGGILVEVTNTHVSNLTSRMFSNKVPMSFVGIYYLPSSGHNQRGI
jgi:hypothetical protein